MPDNTNLDSLRIDAERWRALTESARLRFMGSGGIDHKTLKMRRDVTSMHFGMEAWSKFSLDPSSEIDRACIADSEYMRKLLTAYADEMLAADGFAGDMPSWQRDGRRWQALMASAQLRILGVAGISRETGQPTNANGYMHFGLEAWSAHPQSSRTDDGDVDDACVKQTSFAKSILAIYADTIRSRMSSHP